MSVAEGNEQQQQRQQRLSYDSLISDFYNDDFLDVKHESLKFSLDPIKFDPLRFSFLGLGPLTSSTDDTDKVDVATKAVDLDTDLTSKTDGKQESAASTTVADSETSLIPEQSPALPARLAPLVPPLKSTALEDDLEEESRPYTLLKPVTFSPEVVAKGSKPKENIVAVESQDGIGRSTRNDEKAETDTTEIKEQVKEPVKPIGATQELKKATLNLTPTTKMNVPKHPIASMQGAFAESMYESAERDQAEQKRKSKKKSTPEDAENRRKELLEQDTSHATHASKWNQKPGQQYHELWKLIAQISFGSYLLFDNIANDDETVLGILQDHVNEVDDFLECTLQDFDLSQEDIDERLQCLNIPMENVDVFDQMLADEAFRTSIINGNEQIEHVIARTASAMNDALQHVQQGITATKEFAIWLQDLSKFPLLNDTRQDMRRVYDAMTGNAEGWYKAFLSLQTKGNELGIALTQLRAIVSEMERRAAEVGQNKRFSLDPLSSPTRQISLPRTSDDSRQSPDANHQTAKSHATASIVPAVSSTLPSSQYLPKLEKTQGPAPSRHSEPESTSKTEEQASETLTLLQPTVFTLQPRVYSPPSLSPRPQVTTPPPEPSILKSPTMSSVEPEATSVLEAAHSSEKPSLRQRFSLKRKQVPVSVAPPVATIKDISPLTQHSPVMGPPRFSHLASPRSENGSSSPRQISIAPLATPTSPRQSNQPHPRAPPATSYRSPVQTGPSHPHSTMQSASSTFGEAAGYYPAAHDPVLIPSQLPTPAGSQSLNENYFAVRPKTNAGGTPPYINSPRSDQQHFRPVQANPNSPLQRPWTAAPDAHQQQDLRHSSSNIAMNNHYKQLRDPSSISFAAGTGQSNLDRSTMASNLSSDTALSNRSGETIGLDTEGKKIKKKRSGFGWLKKAFSLSEEERLAFEERRRQTEGHGQHGNGNGYSNYGNNHGSRPGTGYGVYSGDDRGAPKWLDGKRIR